MTDKLLRLRVTQSITSLSKTSLYDAMKAGRFPQPVKIGSRAVAWRESDIMAWMDALEKREAN